MNLAAQIQTDIVQIEIVVPFIPIAACRTFLCPKAGPQASTDTHPFGIIDFERRPGQCIGHLPKTYDPQGHAAKQPKLPAACFTLKDPLCGRRAAAWPELATNFFWLDQPSGCDIAELDELFNPARSIALDRECFVVRLGIPVVIAPLDQQKHGFQ